MAPEKEVDPNVSQETNDAISADDPKSTAQVAGVDGTVDVGNGAGPDVADADGTAEPVSDADPAAESTDDTVVSIDGEVVQADGVDASDALAAAESRADQNWDKLIRLQAEMENQRKRAQKEVSNARKFALEGMVEALLPIRDSLELGLQAADTEDANVASIREGSELTLKMLAQAFEKFNIEEVNPLDEKFNPEFHQAMSMQAVEGKAPNTVTGVLQKGYTLNERLIRPALVMVAK